MKKLQVILLVLYPIVLVNGNDCLSRDYGNGGSVCVCNEEQCHEIPKIGKVEQPNYLIYTSNKAGYRFIKETGSFVINDKRFPNEIVIRNESYQSIFGWGGAFTDATGINIKSVSENLQEKLIRSYFSDDGLEYNLCRVPMGGTDFSTHAYSYNDGPKDARLKNFKLAPEDFEYKIPIIKKALNLTNNNLQLFASTWTAPKWMKVNGNYSGMFGFLMEGMYQTWANYFVKFLDKYHAEGIDFWGITTGNEPSLAMVPVQINSVGWTPLQMKNWISNNLGPTLQKSRHSSIKLISLDDQRFFLPWFIDAVFQNKRVKNYVDGIGVHWYYDTTFSANLLTQTHNKYPDKFILATEACKGDKATDEAVLLGSWQRGEDYANSIIEDVNHWVTGWVDWNMALNVAGGPTYINNNVDSPIIVNAGAREFYKQPMYYTLGHFSKFVPKDSVRIYSSQFTENVPVAAFRRPDGGFVVEILNKDNLEVPAVILDEKRGNIYLNLTPKSLTTILYW